MAIKNKLSLSASFNNEDAIVKALSDAFTQWAEEDINETHWREQFLEREWKYDGKTKRKNPSAPVRDADNPRDIYDFGKLYESGVKSFLLASTGAGIRASWHWDAKNSSGSEYAWYVHEGRGTNKDARKFTDDIAIAASFFLKKPGMALQRRVALSLNGL
jgi:hypothetical protein